MRRLSLVPPSLRLSVIFCCANYQDVEGALRCLRNQTVLPHEIVIVDRSPVSSPLAGDAGDRLKYVHDPSLHGLAQARNRGMAAATGNVVLFMNDCAVPDSRFIEEILAAYKNPYLDGVAGVVGAESGRPSAMSFRTASMRGLRFDEDQSKPEAAIDADFCLRLLQRGPAYVSSRIIAESIAES